eukprot:gene25581-32052_t
MVAYLLSQPPYFRMMKTGWVAQSTKATKDKLSQLNQTKHDLIAFTDCEVDQFVSSSGEEKRDRAVSAVDSRGAAPFSRTETGPTSRGDAPPTTSPVTETVPVKYVQTLPPLDPREQPEVEYIRDPFRTEPWVQREDMSARQLLENKGYSPSEASSILSAFGTRLSELSHFLTTSGLGQADIDARIASKTKDISLFFHHLIEKQNTSVEDRQYAVKIADLLSKYETQQLTQVEKW